ncbi:MAG: hypothetical protein BMS9Abin37_1711 [Acidobacteriota bacterium]|nr:MAG: hypothetical protein BMS9Abin37_1711 [Acidobacteriota bacterium]
MQPQQDETRRTHDLSRRLPDSVGSSKGHTSSLQPLRAIVLVIVAWLALAVVVSYRFSDRVASVSTLIDAHVFHLMQGLLVSFVVAILVVWYLGARREPPFSETWDVRTLRWRHERVRRHAQWFVHMRWVAAAVSLALIFIAVFVAEILSREELVPLLGWWLVLVAANFWFARRLRWVEDREQEIVLQAVVDLLVLTGWLNASGGVENPFYQVYILHVIIAGILLPRREAVFVTVLACVLTSFLAAAEFFR